MLRPPMGGRRAIAVAMVSALAACACGSDRRARDGGEPLEDGGPAGDGAIEDGAAIDGGGGPDDGGALEDAGARDGGDVGTAALTMLSQNLHCLRVDGTAYATNAARFDAIAAFVADNDVAVLAVQEACDDGTTSAIEALRAAIEARTGASWSSEWAFAHRAWEGTADEADEGVGLLVRGAMRDVRTIDHVVQASLRRVTISATLPAELGGVRVASIHFDHRDPAARLGQARETAVAAVVSSEPGLASIVAGDLNDREGTAPHAAFLASGFRDAAADLDARRIDHVFVHRGAPLATRSAALVFTGAMAVSDHPGVLVRFDPAMPEAMPLTRVTARADVGPGHYLAIRGSLAPLDWGSGWPMASVAPGEWRFATTGLAGPFAFKVLRDDVAWQTGPDQNGTPGADHTVTPAF